MSIYSILSVIGALGFFIYGMKIMSEGIQKAAGDKLRGILKAITSNRISGVLTGFVTTSIIQSSSATTVMIVSFVNAGLLTLRQAIGVIMGANIGTTMTAWLLVFLGFSKFSLSSYSLPILAIGVPMLFMKRDQLKSFGEFLVGFALLFMGLHALKNEVKILHLEENQAFIEFITGMGTGGYGAVLLFVLIGTILTVIIQSSSAAMALTLIFVEEGLPLELAAAIVLGENIGTTVTANLAAMIGNVHSKRAARAHFLFNIFGVIWMLIIFFPFVGLIRELVEHLFNTTNVEASRVNQDTLALFHTVFNIINTLILIWFVGLIEKVVIRITPAKSQADEEYSLEYMGANFMLIPEMSILEATKEVAKFGEITSRMNGFVRKYINTSSIAEKEKLIEKISKYEEITDRIEVEIVDYLGEISKMEISEEAAESLQSMLAISGNLERIGDIYYQIGKTLETKDQENMWFLPEQRDNLNHMLDLLDESFEEMNENLLKDYHSIKMDPVYAKEDAVNKYRDELRLDLMSSMKDAEYNSRNALFYSNLFSSLEKVGDHITSVSEAVAGEV